MSEGLLMTDPGSASALPDPEITSRQQLATLLAALYQSGRGDWHEIDRQPALLVRQAPPTLEKAPQGRFQRTASYTTVTVSTYVTIDGRWLHVEVRTAITPATTPYEDGSDLIGVIRALASSDD